MNVEPSRTATLELQERVSDECIVSIDPNWRPDLWESREDFAAVLRGALSNVDLLIASEEDLAAAGFTAEEPSTLAETVAANGPDTVVITLGDAGALCYGTSASPVPGLARHRGYGVDVVDTTGAGDAFFARMIASITHGVEDPEQALKLTNAVGAISTTQLGAVTELSSLDNVRRLHEKIPWA